MLVRDAVRIGLIGWMGVSAMVPPVVRAAEDAAPPEVVDFAIVDSQARLRFTPYPGARAYRVLRSSKLDGAFTQKESGFRVGYDWTSPVDPTAPLGFFRIQVDTIDSKELLVSTVLNRLTYGPTPDEIERVTVLGPERFIEEQLAPELIQEQLDIDEVATPSGWQLIQATGRGSSSDLYVYLTSPGGGYIDDLKVVEGTEAGVGKNLLEAGDFEDLQALDAWTVSKNHSESEVVVGTSHSGSASLRLVASSGGTTKGSSIWRTITPSLSSSKTYTVSFWYLADPANWSDLTVRLSGSGVVASSPPLSPMTRLVNRRAQIADLQGWMVQHAVRSKRQLLEVLTQFVDNHFTTFYDKSRDFLDGKLKDQTQTMLATDLEFRELMKWREVLLDPNGTFYDLLKVSTESPAMVIYLDSVTNTKKAANENFARELMELFTMGVDNGYDQRDIEELSRVWTGWRVEKLPPGSESDPYATRVNDRDKDPGTWSLQYSRTDHDLGEKIIFAGKTVHPRFGPVHAGKSYELKIPLRGPSQGLQDGYDVIERLADLPYTQEYVSVKLCRLLVHEGFRHGIYDYTDPNLSPEAALIRDCMAAWETPAADGRKGNLRSVLKVILGSTLFREQAASRQKVKTPFEFTVSVIRAMRASKPEGGFTGEIPTSILIDRMARMGQTLFRREEPDGWSEVGGDWINTSALVERMRFIQTVLKSGSSAADPVALLKQRLPASQWLDASAVARFFCDLLFLGEGGANLDLDRAAAEAYLNTHENGVTASPFSLLKSNSSGYDTRVRSLVAMMMGLPRFQEQ